MALRQAERAAAARTGAKTRAKKGIAAAPEILRPAKVRLQKALAAAGVTSRRKAEELIAAGAIKVNGKRVTELGTKVDPDRDAIEVRGTRVQLEKKVYFLLNKPDGVVCSAEGPKDNEGRPTVLSLFPELPQRIYPVGRLDFHTRGALILTNDGDLAAALTHPRHEIPKTYHVKFQGKLTEAELGTLATGVTLEDGTVTRPAAEVSVIKETATNTWVQITLRQGLNRQIRRMGEAIGKPVLKLIRVAIGDVTADGLADGEFRPLTPTEVYDLMAAASPAAHPGAQARPRAGGEDSAPGAGGRARSRLAPRKRAG
ncbi:pseudouridine synthase [Nannocystis exedens]|uniref:pseudouridine synthase n=1 Tax=Nannocystis exedens TaxID=54 RepID=UPI001FE8F2E3|nr:pseudouridine synthase [Nannocystis exedens]